MKCIGIAVHPLPLGEGKNPVFTFSAKGGWGSYLYPVRFALLPLNSLAFTLYPLPSLLPAVVRSLSRSVSTFSGVRSS
jgi:hypothetical protein